MNVEEAIRSRRSVRAFTDEPVPQETIQRILELSQRAPSGTNTQPWHTYVCTGAVRDAIVRDVSEMFDKSDLHRDRRRGVGWGLYNLVGIEKGDRAGGMKQAKRNYCFFDAPVGLFFTTDAYLARGSWFDVGLYMQTVMLAARGEGLHTCPQAAWIVFQEPVRHHLNIPDDQVLVSGLSMGYEDTSAIENTLVSDREDVANIVQYSGFD